MSIPRDHHYLPQFYLERWATKGTLFRFVRPRGSNGKLDCKLRSPKAIAYERDLYQLSDLSDAADSQRLEMKLFQQLDDRAATALQKLDQGLPGNAKDRIALSKFMVSLMHRSPSRLAEIRRELATRVDGAPYANLEGDDFEKSLKSTANRLLASLVESPNATSIISSFTVFIVDVSRSSKHLINSDRPVSVSAQLISSDAFMILPISPTKLLILTNEVEIARAFSTQEPNVLVRGINSAVVEQARDIVIAADQDAQKMIDRLFLRSQIGREFDTIGLIRRKSPFVDLRPKPKRFSRHNKGAMRYLGD